MVNCPQINRVPSTALLSLMEAVAQLIPPRMLFLTKKSYTVLKLTVVIQELALGSPLCRNLTILIWNR
jgi:hypothetical protein